MKISVKKLLDVWRTSPWQVAYYSHGKSIRRFFSSKEEAEEHARDLKKTLRLGSCPEQIAEAQRLLAGTGHSMVNVLSMGLAALREAQATRVSPTATFNDGVDRVIKMARMRGRREVTITGYEAAYAPLRRYFGPRVGTTITVQEVEKYLEKLSDRQGNAGKASKYTHKSVSVHLRMALRAIGVANPLPGLAVVLPRGRDINFFSYGEVVKILSKASSSERGMVALALFAAVRPETLERLPPEYVNVADKVIHIPASISKDGYTHSLEATSSIDEQFILPGVPDVLWDWLRAFPFQPRPWTALQQKLRRALDGHWIQRRGNG
jgi:hypothetical protein